MAIQEKDRKEIIQKYLTGNYSCAQLGRDYGRAGHSIARLLKRNRVRVNSELKASQRKFPLNEQYFDEIDTEEKAYFLGFLYADGCNFEKTFMVRLALQERDREILERLRVSIGSEKPLKTSKRKKGQPQTRLEIISKKISKRLRELGCMNAKSLILKFPTKEQVPENLVRHFIRGYFDGDGCVCFGSRGMGKRRAITASILSTKNFCSSLRKLVNERLSVNGFLRLAKPKTNKITTSLTFSANRASCIFLDWLYEDSTIFLKRKYEKFKDSVRATSEEKRNVLLEAFGEKKSLLQWTKDKRCVVGYNSVAYRLKKNLSLEDALSNKRHDRKGKYMP